MVKKLNSLFVNKLWRSALLKALVFGLGLFGIYFFHFSFSAFFFFALLLVWIYFSQLPERGQFGVSFLVLVVTALSSLGFLADSFYPAILVCLIFSFLFYLLLGLTDLIFENRRAVYLFFNTCLFLDVFSLFFGADKSKHYLFINVLLFLAVYLLFEECFNFFRSASHSAPLVVHNQRFISLVFSFLVLELFWAVNLLPIGFINSALLLALFVFLMRDFVLIYFSGRLNRRFFANHFIIFIILVIFIFANSKWSI